jgi:integrase/recombinase XerD
MQKHRKKEITVEALLYKYYTNKEGRHPARLKVTANRASRFYPIQTNGQNIFLNKSEWDSLQSKQFKEQREAIADAEASARDAQRLIMHNERPFDFNRFEKEFLQHESKKGLISIWEAYLAELLGEGRAGTHTAYKNALQAFKNFRGEIRKKREIIKPFTELSPGNLSVSILKEFDQFLTKRGCGKTTVGMYMRALKVIYNLAANENPSLKELYPFASKQNDKGKYKIKTGSGTKGEALSLEQIQSFINIETLPASPEYEAKLLWLFSFYCQGMNFKDIAFLRYKDVQWDSIKYVRHKTKDTESKEATMQVPLSDQIKQIILAIGNPDKSPLSFVFQVVAKEQDPARQDALIRQKIKITNKWLKSLCAANDLPEITTYWARHSYANLLKQTGESIEMIKELLGHSDVRTTESYLKRFDLSRKQAVNDKIHAILKAS